MRAAALALALLAAPAMALEAIPFVPMPHDTRESVDDLHPTCVVDDWWSYNRSCCCTHGWCAPILSQHVREEAGGFRVTLNKGDHPRITGPVTFWIPGHAVGRSPDGRPHFCGSMGHGRCLLIAPGGM
jgi:hypothetical protein